MFVDPDMQRPLLYSKLGEQFRTMQRRVGVPEDELTGPHGLRVSGYNEVKSGLGAALAQAHGLWKSAVHERYERFRMEKVVRIPAVIAGVDEGDAPVPTNEAGERAAGPPARRLRRADLRQVSGDDASDDSMSDDQGASEQHEASAEEPSDEEEQSAGATSEAVQGLLSLTPGGSTARPGGYWGQVPHRPGRGGRPVPRAQSPPTRRSPSASRD